MDTRAVKQGQEKTFLYVTKLVIILFAVNTPAMHFVSQRVFFAIAMNKQTP